MSRSIHDSRRAAARLKTLAHRGITNMEEMLDISWANFSRRLGLNEPTHIAAYNGYLTADEAWITGRVLANAPLGGPQEDDGWFQNLKATYQRWESDEIADAPVKITFRGHTREVSTDREGYYQVKFPNDAPQKVQDSALVEYLGAEGANAPIQATHRLYGPAASSDYLVISDMDDTVIHTGITNLVLAAQLTFLNNAKTRKPLTGVSALYQALQQGGPNARYNPIFYVSNSGWNMYDLLVDFLALNDIPAGPLMLRDLGLALLEQGSRDHKIDTIRMLMQRYPSLPAVLVGDSGQHDAAIYQSVRDEFPGRVIAIYIRDVDPDISSKHDQRVDAIASAPAEEPVPFLRVRDSGEIATHLRSLELLSDEQLETVISEVGRDTDRERLALELLTDSDA